MAGWRHACTVQHCQIIVHTKSRAPTPLASEGRHAGRAPQTQTSGWLLGGPPWLRETTGRHVSQLISRGPARETEGEGRRRTASALPTRPARPRLHLVLRREDVPPRKAVEGDRRRQQPQQRAGPAKRLRQVLHLRCEHHGFCSPPLGPRAACLILSPSAVARVLHLCAERGRYRAVSSEHHVHTRGYEYEYNEGSSHSRARLGARASRNTRTCVRI